MIIKRGKNIWYRIRRGLRYRAHRRHFDCSSVRAAEKLQQPNILHVNLTGFGTDPAGPCNGMREQADVFHAMYPESDSVFDSYRELEDDPIGFCNRIINLIRTGNNAGPYTKVIMRGHSFGGAALLFLLTYMARQGIVPISLAIFYDPVPNPMLGQFGSWKLPLIAPEKSLCFLQTHGAAPWLVFPCGTQVDGATCINVSLWEGPPLYHSTMISDPAVWSIALRAMRLAVNPIEV